MKNEKSSSVLPVSPSGMNRRKLLQGMLMAGGAVAGTSLVGRSNTTYANQPGVVHVVDVVNDFGAKGDGIADDTGPISDAITFTPEGLIFFPPGIYRVRSTLLIQDKPIILTGSGMGASVIHYEGDGDAVVFESTVDRETEALGPIRGAGVRDIRIQGTGVDSRGAGLRLINGPYISVERVWVRDFGGPGGTGLRLDGIDFYLANVHLQTCDVGMVVDFTFQTTAVNLMVNQNTTGGAKFIHAGSFRWIGGLVQGDGDFGVSFEPDGPAPMQAVTLDGLHFEGDFLSHIRSTLPPPGGTKIGVTNLTIRNNRLGRSSKPVKFIDLAGVLGLDINNNRFFYGWDEDVLLKLRDCAGVVIGLSDINFTTKQNKNLVDVEDVEVIWLGGKVSGRGASASGLAVGTARPPVGRNLEVRGVTEVEDLIVSGQATFHSTGSGTIPAGNAAAVVSDNRVNKGSHITVTLNGNPGADRGVRWIKNRYNDSSPGFTVMLNEVVENKTPFTYTIIN